MIVNFKRHKQKHSLWHFLTDAISNNSSHVMAVQTEHTTQTFLSAEQETRNIIVIAVVIKTKNLKLVNL